jgi:hypothetical protein
VAQEVDMPFVHPGIFWTGLAAAAVPVIIHLLSRRRFRVRYWAAMRFLMESLRRNRRRLRIEELILLALRCLIVVVLAAGLARFTGCTPTGILPGEGASRTVVYVLDDSPSMTQTAGDTSGFAAAKEDLTAALAELGKGDRVAVLRTGAAEGDEPVVGLSFVEELNAETLTARLRALPAADVRARMGRALAAAEAALRDVDGPKWVVLLGDFRRPDLAAGGRDAPLRERFDALRAAGAKLVAMDYARPPRDNLTMQSVQLLDRYAVAGVPARVRVTVRNNGPGRARDVKVRVRMLTEPPGGAGELVEASLPVQTFAAVDAGATRHVELPVTFPRAAPAVLAAELPPDELAADNTAHLAVDVRDALRVLIVDGDVEGPTAGGALFLARAIDPNRDGGYGYRAEVISPARLDEADLRETHVVVLVNVPSFPPSAALGEQTVETGPAAPSARYPQVAALERFVRSGGGLAIFTGPRVNSRFYNRYLWAAGGGLLPVRLAGPAGPDDLPGGFVRLESDSIRPEDPLRVFTGEGAAITQLIRFYGFTRTEPPAARTAGDETGPPNVLARFADRDRSPAVVSRRFGQGTIVLFTTTAGTRWTDWPTGPLSSYVAAMLDMTAQLARPQSEGLTAVVGEPVVYDLPEALRDARATLRTPRYPAVEKLTLVPRVDEHTRRLRCERAHAAGIYTLELTPPAGAARRLLLARNLDPDEGELTPGGRTGLAAAFGSDEFRYVPRTGPRPADTAAMEDRRDLWKWALAALLVLLAAETLLARRFGHYGNT